MLSCAGIVPRKTIELMAALLPMRQACSGGEVKLDVLEARLAADAMLYNKFVGE